MSKFVSNENLSEFKKKCDEVYAKQSGTYQDMIVGKAIKAEQDNDGNVIKDTYAKQIGNYPNLYAGRAAQDENGNNIEETYAPLDNSKNIKNSNGGFAGGNGASSLSSGAAIGANSTAYGKGAAIGDNAMLTNAGGAIGADSRAGAGGAIGYGATAEDGFAGGENAKATGEGSVQLGAGTNNNSNTLQFRDTQIVNENGELTDVNTYAGSEHFSIKNPNTRTTSSNYYSGVSFKDNNAVLIGKVQGGIFTNDSRKVFLEVDNSSGTFVDSLGVETDETGLQNNTRGFAPKPYDTAANNDTIVTMDVIYPGGNMDINSAQSGQFRYRNGTYFGIKINTTYLNYSNCWFRLTRVGNLVIVGGSMGVKSTINAHTATTIVTGLPPISHNEAGFYPATTSNNAAATIKVDTSGNLQVTPETGTSLVSGTQIIFGFIYPTVAN